MAGEVVLIDPATGQSYRAGSPTTGPQPAASSQSVTPASDGAAFPTRGVSSTVSTGASGAASGTIVASGGTAALTMTSTTRSEVINPSASTMWGSWGTPAVNGAGSFPILTGGQYNVDRVAGTLTLLSTTANQTYTVNRFTPS